MSDRSRRRHSRRLCDRINNTKRVGGNAPDVNAMTNWTPLHTAVKNGEIATVARLIESGSDLDARTQLFWTPLHFAAKYGQFDCCRLLIEAGASISVPTKLRFFTPLHIAALEGRTNIVQLFLEHGADLNLRTAEGWTPLHAAVEHAHRETVRFLLERGADPNLAKRTTKATFPLHSAARNGRRDILQLLLDYGADPNVQNKYGKYPKDFAKENGFPLLAELLKTKPESPKPSKEPDATWMDNLIRSGDLQLLENWLNEGGSVSYVPKNGLPPLFGAVLHGLPKTVRFLLERGANPNIKAGWHSDGLVDFAITSSLANSREEFVEIVNILLDYGAKVTLLQSDGPKAFVPNAWSMDVWPLALLERLETEGMSIDPVTKKKIALRWAVKVQDHTQAEELLKDGADPNAGNKFSDIHTPLTVAIRANDVEMVRLLVKYGANVNDKSCYNNSFLADAVGQGNLEIVKILVEAGANVNHKTYFGSPIQAALREGNTEIVDYLLERGADIESHTNWARGNSTPIFDALAAGDSESVQKLIDKGADIHVVGDFGNTLLHVAAENGLTKWVEYFLDQGLDIEAENRNRYRPIHLAVLCRLPKQNNPTIRNRKDEVVQYLLNRGASVEPPPGVSPTNYAIMLGRADLLDTALKNKPNKPPQAEVYPSGNPLPILVALQHGRFDLVEMLAQQGASVTASQNFYHHEGAQGESALSYVSRNGMKEMLERFLRLEVNVNSKASILPALHSSASPEIAQLLLEHGANPYLRSNEHKTALECQTHNPQVAAFLREVMSREN